MKKPHLLAYLEQMTKGNTRLGKRPLVEILGENRVLIENHFGIISYCLEEIRIKVAYGNVAVKGRGLQLMEICKEQLVISGYIEAVHLNRR